MTGTPNLLPPIRYNGTVWTAPAGDGTSGQFLATNSYGQLYWQSADAYGAAATVQTNLTNLTNSLGSAAYQNTSAFQAPISLTTTGTSGTASFAANTLNIPNYTYTLPQATNSVLGGVKVDNTTITASSGVISATQYSLPTASTSVLGGVKVDGTTISINTGVISVSNSAPMLFSALTSATNTQAAMVVGSGSSISTSGTGTVVATSSAAMSISGQTGQLTFTGLTSTNRAKTVRDAADTILELGGTYTPSGTWNWTSATVTWPTFNQNTTGSAGSVAAANITGTTLASNVVSSSLTSVGTLTGLTVSGQTTISANGAASTSPLQLTGSWFTGGTGTTTFPALNITANGATAPSSYSVNGVCVGLNGPASWTGNFIEARINGASGVFFVASTGGVAAAYYAVTSKSRMLSGSDGTVQFTNNAQTGFTNLQLGPTVAAPTACTLQVGDVVAGNGNTAAGNFTIRGGLSNGSGGGDIIFATTASSAGSGTQNTATTALTIKGGTQAVIFAAVPQFSGTNTTGSGSAALGANCPAVTATAPYTWVKITTSDGSSAYIPCWK
jgi:hypothetical protein